MSMYTHYQTVYPRQLMQADGSNMDPKVSCLYYMCVQKFSPWERDEHMYTYLPLPHYRIKEQEQTDRQQNT